MSVIAHSNLSSDQRPVALRVRRDLVISESTFQGETAWIVKDPVALKYFRLRCPEHQALRMLDGTHSYRQIMRSLQRAFPEQKITVADVQQLVHSLHQSGLLVSSAIGQAMPLRQRRNKEIKQKAMGLAASIIAIRFPGVDPDRFLNWLHPKTKWFFTPIAATICVILMVAASLQVLTNFNQFVSQLPDFQQFFGFDNLLFMAVVLILTKSIHELGHGLMCKHFGGQCHEIGFMLLVMTPAMYCNTSDSWVLPNKWQRIAIGAAGMYVELVMAALATFVWWHTNPGWLHYFCLNVMFLSSVSTIVFNANPLLRYDGYYMLSDFLEIPNLSQKSKKAMLSKLRVWCLGMKPVAANQLPQRHQVAFAIYSVASFVYRWFVMLMIFWFLREIFEPYGLAVVGELLISIALVGMVAMPAYQMFKFFNYPGRFREVKSARLWCSTVLLGACVWAFCFVPLPHHVHCHFVLRPDNAQAVYVTQPGTLTSERVNVGQSVLAGHTLAQLQNDDLSLQLVKLVGQRTELQSQHDAQSNSRHEPVDASDSIRQLELRLEAISREIVIRRRQIQALTLAADRNGIIIPPPNVPAPPHNSNTSARLTAWSGTPLDEANVGAVLQSDTLLCYVGDPNVLVAELVIGQSDVKFLLQGQAVEMLPQANSDRRIDGELAGFSRDSMTTVPRELSQTNGGPIAVQMGAGGNERPMLKLYQATVAITAADASGLLPGFHGQAKIHVGQASLGSRLWRQLLTTIRFR